MSPVPEELQRLTLEAAALVREHPPKLTHANKRLAWEIAGSSGCPFAGRIDYARWRAIELPAGLDRDGTFCVRPGVYEYSRVAQPHVVAWYLNFADPRLFVAYGSGLLAQDELQVVEHPALACVREAILARDLPALTIDPDGAPTPVTVTGVQRRCIVQTEPDASHGLPSGLYGNAFARASEEELRLGVTALDEPTVTNIVAAAAPSGGLGRYDREDVTYVLTAASTAFAAARLESRRLDPSVSRTVVHTGFWGCGAFGGDRSLMTILQALAADIAGVEIVFWAVSEAGVALATSAREAYEDMRAESSRVAELLERLDACGFRWGVSNGT